MTTTERKPDLTFFYSPFPKYGFEIKKLNEGLNFSYISITNIYADFQMTQLIGKLGRSGFVNTLGGNAINSYAALIELPEGSIQYNINYNNSILTDNSPRSVAAGSAYITGGSGAFEFSKGVIFTKVSEIEAIRINYVYFNK